jgi:hypothetical protein
VASSAQVVGKKVVAFSPEHAAASCLQSRIPGIEAHTAASAASGSLQPSAPAAAPCLQASHPGIECEEHIAWTAFVASGVLGASGRGPGRRQCGTVDPRLHRAFQGSHPFIFGISVQIVPTREGWWQ